MESGAAQALTLAVAGVALVFGALGAAVSAFTLLRGAPTRLELQTQECVGVVTQVKGEWEATRSGLDALLDSIHSERENVQKAQNRLSARKERNGPALPQSRDQQLAELRRTAGLT